MSTFEDVFCDAEEQAFRFLATEYGFLADMRQVDRVSSIHGVYGRAVYQNGAISPGYGRKVELYIAPLRLELALEVSGHGYGPYSIEELHALDGKGLFPGREHGLYDAMHSPEELLAEFTRLAKVLRAAGSRFFADSSSVWDALQAQRKRRAQDEEIKRTLALAKELFRERDWLGVVALLAPIEGRLGKRASARLAYASRKASGET